MGSRYNRTEQDQDARSNPQGDSRDYTSLSDQLVPKDKFKQTDDSDVLICAGSHFAVLIKNSSGERTCILDYDFMKPKNTLAVYGLALEGDSAESEKRPTDTNAKEDDGSSAQAPFKKKACPLSISNIGLEYSEKKFHIMFDATFEPGPLGFSLIGFSIDLGITSLDKIPEISASIQGLSAAFEKPPLSIAGIIRHGNTGTLDYYAGGLIIGFIPSNSRLPDSTGKPALRAARSSRRCSSSPDSTDRWSRSNSQRSRESLAALGTSPKFAYRPPIKL